MKRVSLLMALLVMFALVGGCAQATPETVVEEKEVTTEVEVTSEVEVTTEVEKVVTATPEPKGGTVIYGFSDRPNSMDPSVWTGRSDNALMRQIFDSLIYSPAPGEYEPWLAESWEISEDGTVFTFKLREDVTFHDGTPLNAEAFKFTYDRMVDPETRSLRAGDLGPYERTEVIDEYTFAIHLEEPYAPLMNNAAALSLVPVSPAAVEEYGDDFANHPVGTGPFMFEKWEGNDVHLVANPDYNWAPESMGHQGPAYLESLIYREVPEPATRMVAVETGDVNITHYPVYEELGRMRAEGFSVFNINTPGYAKCMPINVEYPPTDDILVRKAMEYTINRQQVVDLVMQGWAQVSYGPLTHASMCYDPAVEDYYSYDPEKAAELLEEAGWVDTDGDGIREKDGENLELRLISFSSPVNDAYAEVTQAMLNQMGFDVTVDLSPYDEFAEQVSQGNFNLAEMNWVAMDPHVVLRNMLHSTQVEGGGQFNRSRVRSEELDELIDQGERTLDVDERCEIYSDVQNFVMENALQLNFWDGIWVRIARPELKGMNFDTVGRELFYDAYID